MEIRTTGQQYTVVVDGEVINQFDNSIPKIASRAGDPPTMARQLARGYLGLQTHGGNDRINYKEMQVKEFAPSDLPVNTVAPSMTGSGIQGLPLTCNHGEWTAAAGSTRWVTWYRANRIPEGHPRFRAPSQLDYNNTSTPAEPEYGTQNLTGLDAQIVGQGDTYTPTAEDAGKNVYCQVSVDNAGATVFKPSDAKFIATATHTDGGAGASVPATLSLSLGTAASFGAFTPGMARDYDASTTANVISTAGSALLTVSDRGANPGRLVDGRSRSRAPCRPAHRARAARARRPSPPSATARCRSSTTPRRCPTTPSRWRSASRSAPRTRSARARTARR